MGTASDKRAPAVAVCGASRVEDPKVEEAAFELGMAVALQGWNLVCGGMGGVMEAACRGVQKAREEGRGKADSARAVGIVPGPDFHQANDYCDVVIPTGLGVARNSLVVRAGDVVVLVNGASGTLSEAAFAWQMGKPLVALATTGGWAEELAQRKTLDRRSRSPIHAARDPKGAVDWIKDYLQNHE